MTGAIDGAKVNVDVCNVTRSDESWSHCQNLAGVTKGNSAPVQASDMSSKANADIYVLGDASHQGDMPRCWLVS